MKKLICIVLSNWIHLPGFYFTVYISGIIFKVVGLDSNESWVRILIQSPISILLAFILYGSIFIIGFYVSITFLDIILFCRKKQKIKWIVFAEWIAISSPFIYWAIKYDFWIWISLSISFLATQIMRIKKIENALLHCS